MSENGGPLPESLPVADADAVVIPETLPVLPLRGFVVFPGALGPITVKNPQYVQMINTAAVRDRLLAVVLAQDDSDQPPHTADLHDVGTAVKILKLINTDEGELNFICQGLCRISIGEYVQESPHMIARTTRLVDDESADAAQEARLTTLRNQFSRLVELSPQMADQLKMIVLNISDVSRLIDFVITNIQSEVAAQQRVLAERSLNRRLQAALGIVQTELGKAELSSKIQQDLAEEFTQQQREHILRQQMRKIREELGEKDEQQREIDELRDRIAEAEMPEEAQQAALKEVERLSMMSPAAPEYSVVRTYLDWLIGLPWATATEDQLAIESARDILDEDHYDLEKVKKRILEYIAVRKLNPDKKGPILCFYGPPGVGKTSLGRSIARALGRTFVRISLGGVHDEAEIRGHRRTYVGALPGRIIQGVNKAGSRNPVFMLDEIDKLGADFRGDPSSALLEVLDPEQNSSFSDHYLEVTFDLSSVFFITTANNLETIPPALRDRLEVLELPGYTEEEKLHIARTYIVPRQIAEHGLQPEQVEFASETLSGIVRNYTREAGVRNLEREIASVCRGIARKVAEGLQPQAAVAPADLTEYLGQQKFFPEVAERITTAGIATGLAWTPAGGDIMFVEVTRMPGKKGLLLTGQLGDVMKESAQTALSYVRANAAALGVADDFYEFADVHMHVPAGAIPKDGPSAGVTMTCALVSLLTGRLIRSDVALTGEITLRGKVLPVGGIKEKVLAAKRAGIATVILPRLNRKDIAEAPAAACEGMQFVYVDRIDEAIDAALIPPV